MLNDKGVVLLTNAIGTQEPHADCRPGDAGKEGTLINLCCWLAVPMPTLP